MYVGALSLGVAFMSSTFAIRVIHTFVTSAGWEDSLDSNDPISSLVAMIAYPALPITCSRRSRTGMDWLLPWKVRAGS